MLHIIYWVNLVTKTVFGIKKSWKSRTRNSSNTNHPVTPHPTPPSHPIAFAQFKEQKTLILCVFCPKNASTAKTKGDMKKCLCTNLFSIKFWFKGVIVWGSTINATPRSRRFLRRLLSKECFYSLNYREIWKNFDHKLVHHKLVQYEFLV